MRHTPAPDRDAPAGAPALPPRRIDRIERRQILGRGAGSEVSRVRVDGVDYALKESIVSGNGADARAQARRYRREAALHAGLSPGFFPAVHEVGIHDGRPYLIAELIDGPTLESRLASGPLPVAETLALGCSLALALAEVHDRGLVHRDVKPGNILLPARGGAVLIDFGLAVRVGGDESQAGTLRYAAPEQLGLLPLPVDGRADLYGLGCVLFECLSGRPPFDEEDPAALLHAHVARPAPALATLCPGVPPALAAVVERMLQKDPASRPPGAAQLARRLAVVADELGLGDGLPAPPALHRAPPAGRDAALALLDARVAAARSGAGCVVAVQGAEGLGKRRLLRHLCQHRLPPGATVLWGSCGDTGRPLAPLREAFRDWAEDQLARPAADRAALQARARELAGPAAPLLARLDPAFATLLGHPADPGGRGAPGAPAPTATDGADLVARAVVRLLGRLAEHSGMLVLVIDQLTTLDPATARVLRLLHARVAALPVLLVYAGGVGPETTQALHAAWAEVPEDRWWAVALDRVSDADIARIIDAAVGEPGSAVGRQLAGRARGNPMVAVAYVERLQEAGLLEPRWGHWLLAPGALERVALPARLEELMGARLDGLSAATRRVLAHAALFGRRFTPEAVVATAALPAAAVGAALGAAREARVIEADARGGFGFVHPRLREACRATLGDGARAAHARAADHLDQLPAPRPAERIASAGHHLAAGPLSDVAAVRACVVAGRVALADFADGLAHRFLEAAAAQPVLLARALDPAARARFHRDRALACFRTQDMAAAHRAYAAALDAATTPLGRAAARQGIARAHMFSFDTPAAAAELVRALGELGVALPAPPAADPAARQAALVAELAAQLPALLGEVQDEAPAPGGSGGAAVPRDRALLALAGQVVLLGYYDRNPFFAFQGGILAARTIRGLGASADTAPGLAKVATLFALAGRAAPARQLTDAALRWSRLQQDPRARATTRSTVAFALHMVGDADGALRLQREVFEEHGDWLGPIEFQNCCIDLAWNLSLRGHAREALAISEAALARLGASGDRSMAAYACRATAACMVERARLGDMAAAAEERERLRSFRRLMPWDRPTPWVSVEGFLVGYYREQEDDGPACAATIARHAAFGIPPARSALQSQHAYMNRALMAQDHLVKALSGRPGAPDRAAACAALAAATAVLKAAARTPVQRAHIAVFEGLLALVDERLDDAWAAVSTAARLATRHDVPWARARAALLRARLLRHEGRTAGAEDELALARRLARRHGWVPMLRRIERAHPGVASGPLPAAERRHGPGPAADAPVGAPAEVAPLRVQLAGLLALGRATALVLDPEERARVVLDEINRLLGAERAFLFLHQEGGLRCSGGRDATGTDLVHPGAYSTTVVEQVWSTGTPLLVATRADAGELGSHSLLAHDLRSVIAVPLLDTQEKLGVVYVENRLAHGVFDHDKLLLLEALAGHIASALRTARAARLESDLAAEQERRRIAEVFGSFAAELSATLAPDEIVDRLAWTLYTALTADTVAVVELDASGGASGVALAGNILSPPDVPALVAAVATAGHLGPVALPWRLLPGTDADGRSWTAIPFFTEAGAEVAGWAFIGRHRTGAQAEDDLGIGRGLVQHAGVALQNARLFARMERMATRDALTGLINRGEFFRQAAQALDRDLRSGEGLCAAMLDVDHFKAVNDTHGHATGDAVLQAVAAAAGGVLRSSDLVGRYGGEEFGLLLPGADMAAAAEVCERVRAAVGALVIRSEAGAEVCVSISIGVARRGPGEDLASLLQRADAALYAAKHGGRDRVVQAPGARADDAVCGEGDRSAG